MSQWNFLKVDILLLKIKNLTFFLLRYTKIIIIIKKNYYYSSRSNLKFAKNSIFKIKIYFANKEFKTNTSHKFKKIGVNLNSKIALIKLRETKNSHYRNSNITRLISVIKYLIKQNYKVIRIVDKSSKNSNFKNKN